MQCREKTVRGKVLEIALRLLCKTYSTDNAACREELCALLRNTSWGHCEYCSRARGDSGWTDGHCVSGGHTPLALHSSDIVCTVQCTTLPLLCIRNCCIAHFLWHTVVPHFHYICRSLGTCRSSLWAISTSFIEYLPNTIWPFSKTQALVFVKAPAV